jgi:NAD(P)H-hydrate epimerase
VVGESLELQWVQSGTVLSLSGDPRRQSASIIAVMPLPTDKLPTEEVPIDEPPTEWLPVDELPSEIYTSEQVRALDRFAIEDFGTPGYELMRRAAVAALSVLQSHWPEARDLLIYCGAGNNAGDGYVLGRLAAEEGMAVRILAVTAPETLNGDAATAWRDAVGAGVTIQMDGQDEAQERFRPDLVVDALLGTGLDRPLTGAFDSAARAINAASAPVLALDLPTGLHADSGAALGPAVFADATVTFVGLKSGCFLGVGPDHCGALYFSSLGIPAEARAGLEPVLRRLGAQDLAAALPRRRRTAHKGEHGRIVLVGGGPGMGGAIRLAAEAALRVGAGLVYVGTHPDNLQVVMAGRPEIMCHGISQPDDLAPLLERADAVVLGPGLGLGDWSRAVWDAVIAAEKPLVVDADALTLLAERGASRAQWVLTPHPGEAARLLGTDSAAVQLRRLACAGELAARFRATTVLKGACSLIAHADGATVPAVCDRGNPGMATGGTGDILSGVIGGLLAQSRDLDVAVRAAVLVHALAGDDAAAEGERGMIASDLLVHIRRWANPL